MNGSQQSTARPARITVATDAEPVTAQGEYTALADGFVLRFDIGTDAFTIEHTDLATVITARGVMSYRITLGSGITDTLLDTPFGKVRFDVKPVLRDVRVAQDEVHIMLQYILSSDAAGTLDRAVALTAHLQ